MALTYTPRHPKPAVGLVMQSRTIGDQLYAVGGLGSGGFVLRSGDDGKTWAPTEWRRTIGAGAWKGMMPSASQHGLRHIAGTPEQLFVVGEYGTLLSSVDSGETFTREETKGTGCVFGIGVRKNVLYTAGDDGVFRRGIGKKTWKKIDATRDLCRIFPVGDDLWVIGDHSALLHIGPDDVVTRVRVGADGDYYGFCAVTDQRLVLVGTGGLVALSDDGGATWTAGTSGVSGRLMAVARLGDETLIAVGQSGTVITSTSGLRWTVEEGPGRGDLWGVTTDARDPRTAWIAGDGGKVWRVKLS